MDSDEKAHHFVVAVAIQKQFALHTTGHEGEIEATKNRRENKSRNESKNQNEETAQWILLDDTQFRLNLIRDEKVSCYTTSAEDGQSGWVVGASFPPQRAVIASQRTSYCIRMMWQPLKLVGGKGGTYSCSFLQSSVSPALILPRFNEASSRVSVCTTRFFAMY
ncbi:hypothetical protein OUZ56_001241 [Daphnia magna]|uniref:Uncharacterized protein n=1 Tax=Daphnia magna TaxID=35525 RepID=A0ABR0A250_9CRUS|nr:hypothetical protein OUZ56_001241 [Daphnia magna]